MVFQNETVNTTEPSNSIKNVTGSEETDDGTLKLLIAIPGITVTLIVLLAFMWTKKFRSLIYNTRELRQSPPTPAPVSVTNGYDSLDSNSASTLEMHTSQSASSSLRNPKGTSSCLKKNGLGIQQLIKAGRVGVYYKAKMLRGTYKGHTVTCKLVKAGVSHKKIAREVKILRKLGTHKNVLQLLNWNISQTPYILIMEPVSCGTLRSFLQGNQEQLKTESNLQDMFTIAAYRIANAMCHLSSKQVVHCDLALRNIMVNQFPAEVKVTEFGMARDLTYMGSRHGTQSGKGKAPVRWYPPEFFRNNYYSFKGDVWSFGILLWEMETFGSLPYANMETPEEVMQNVCSGYRNTNPENCRPELCVIMRDCWLELHTQRPSFNDIVRDLENILENDADYVRVESIDMASIVKRPQQ